LFERVVGAGAVGQQTPGAVLALLQGLQLLRAGVQQFLVKQYVEVGAGDTQHQVLARLFGLHLAGADHQFALVVGNHTLPAQQRVG